MTVSNCNSVIFASVNFDIQKFCVYKIVTKMYDYVFSENGLVAYKNGELAAIQVKAIVSYHTTSVLATLFQNIKKQMGEEKIQKFINFCLRYMSELKLPKKRSLYSILLVHNFTYNFAITLQGYFH